MQSSVAGRGFPVGHRTDRERDSTTHRDQAREGAAIISFFLAWEKRKLRATANQMQLSKPNPRDTGSSSKTVIKSIFMEERRCNCVCRMSHRKWREYKAPVYGLY